MKRLIAMTLAALASASLYAATLNPIQLLNPAGSTAGQAIVSTGASSAPAWTNIPSANSPAFTGYSTFTNTAAGASVLTLTGNGSTTPNKFLGVLSGNFTIYSSSGAAPLLVLSDIGTLAVSNIAANATGTQATAGNQGYAVSYSTGAASATAGSPMNVASTTTPLSVGVWDVTCTGQFVPAGSTVTQAAQIGVSTTSGALPGYTQLTNSAGVTSAGFSQVFTSPSVRIPVATPTTVYCVAQANFTVSTMTIGGTITARLVH